MRIHIVSDVHGATQDLANAAHGSDLFVCLGDLLLYLDYEDPHLGAFAEVFGAQTASDYIALRLDKRFDEARALTAARWEAISGGESQQERMVVFSGIIERQYREIFDAMPRPAVLTYGNVDVPSLWARFVKPEHTVIDGGVVEVGGLRLGFVGSGLHSPYRTPNEITDELFAAKLSELGKVDILFTHIPPSVAELTFDVVARRFEVGSPSLLEWISDMAPRYAFFGHVHQPLAQRVRLGRTECINVGHFRRTRRPYVIDVEPIRSSTDGQ